MRGEAIKSMVGSIRVGERNATAAVGARIAGKMEAWRRIEIFEHDTIGNRAGQVTIKELIAELQKLAVQHGEDLAVLYYDDFDYFTVQAVAFRPAGRLSDHSEDGSLGPVPDAITIRGTFDYGEGA
jgi:hypothetical protein